MILVLDCETTGLPRDYQAPLTDFDNWPRAVQIAWACFDDKGQFLRKANHIIFPKGFEIPEAATALHGITTAQAQTEGVSIETVLTKLAFEMVQADWVVAHNIDFDASVLGAEFLRADLPNHFETVNAICTMRESTEFCALPGNKYDGYKWPKLSELYGILFDGAAIEGEHNAEVDVLACAKCFFALIEKRVITLAMENPMTEQPETYTVEQELPADEIGFDEPAADIFTPLELQGLLRNAYNWQARARADLFNAARTVEFRKRELRQKQTQLRMGEAYSLLKNAEMRETYLASECAELVVLQDAAENEFAEARMHFDNASAEVEQTRALLRIAELAQAQAAQADDNAFPGLLIPKKGK